MQLIRPYQSRIPDAMDAVIAAATAAFMGSDPRVFVRDGPWIAAESGGAYAMDMAIGWYGFYPGYQYPTRSLSEELGEAQVSATNQEEGWAPAQEETFTVGCASLVLTGNDPSNAEASKLRRMTYDNIATMARYMASPEAGQIYLNDTVMKLVIARQNSSHMVNQRRGVLAITTFSLEMVAVSQQ